MLARKFPDPTILMLGSSEHICFYFREFLESKVSPHRVHVFFNADAATPQGASYREKKKFNRNNRRSNLADWREEVYSLMESVPFIVVHYQCETNSRGPTRFLEEEMDHICCDEQLVQKTIIAISHEEPLPAKYDMLRQSPEFRVLHELAAMGLQMTSPDINPKPPYDRNRK